MRVHFPTKTSGSPSSYLSESSNRRRDRSLPTICDASTEGLKGHTNHPEIDMRFSNEGLYDSALPERVSHRFLANIRWDTSPAINDQPFGGGTFHLQEHQSPIDAADHGFYAFSPPDRDSSSLEVPILQINRSDKRVFRTSQRILFLPCARASEGNAIGGPHGVFQCISRFHPHHDPIRPTFGDGAASPQGGGGIRSQFNQGTFPDNVQSRSVSSQSLQIDVPDERPIRRRKTSLQSPGSKPSSQTSRRSHVTSSRRRSTRTIRSPRKKNEALNSQIKSYAFSTFSLDLTPAEHEPIGATSMSTVDFRNNTDNYIFEHGPTNLPPRPYIGGPDASSPWKPRKNLGAIPGSALDYLPIVEDRMARLERALDQYLQYRGQKSVQNSILPGMEE